MVILLTFVTFLCVLAAAVYDLQQTKRALRENRHSAMTRPDMPPDTHV